ncbi:cytochrome c biogenesis CcdA family protein [Labrys wisconsinensis]|uniref:Cytochrome c-type biogenesis protein n=1 Tax=Labrys wisconsinensis TaxID=425677 RepID=A0ABU0JKS3_9HYPH|nr:cytochrome c biogenesis protein CcdA [Labrys wisconsinensis]MDQ0474897.1 cytochrome c-type biogenesis protein [Labrys wisconsinensis]
MADITLPAVFLAGLASFLSPCVLPLVPPYLTYLTGTTLDRLAADSVDAGVRRRAILVAALFVAGFATVFVILGATASVFGQLVRQHLDLLGTIAGIAIIVMGLHFLGLFRIGFLYREARFQGPTSTGLWSAYAMGLAFAFGWTPCIGPVLATVLAVAGREQSVGQGAFLLALYSAGLGVPFLAAAFAMGPFVRFLKRFRAHLGTVEKVMGGVLVLAGIAFLTGATTNLSYWLLETFPALGLVG